MRMSLTVVVVGSLGVILGVILVAVFVPTFIWNPQDTLSSHPLTAEEYRGYTIYYQNQCWVCHTIYTRYFDNSGYSVSLPGDYNYYMPVLLGSERTGPGLSDFGRKKTLSWDIEHFERPRAMMPNSIMPNFYWMSEDALHDLGTFLFNKGDDVAAEWQMKAPAAYTDYYDPLPISEVQPLPVAMGWPTRTDAGLQEGKELYIARCVDCHGCAGNGLGPRAGTLFITPANLKVPPFSTMSEEQWFWRLSEGVPGTPMPVWKMSDLTELQIWHIIRYVRTIFANPVMRAPDEDDPFGIYEGLTNPLPLDVAVLEEGKTIFLRECMICHNDTGNGNGSHAAGLQPPPPNFHDPSQYNDFTDADIFWRLREGVPWTAMPSWKIRYSEADLWKVAHFLRLSFFQTEPRPPTEGAMFYPQSYSTAEMPPSGVTYEGGKVQYIMHCAKCHGFDGTGNGWLGEYLQPMPANFTRPIVRGLSDGDWFARESLGVQNSAMPPWGEFLTVGERWGAIRYIIDAFVTGRPVNVSQYSGKVISDMMLASPGEWMDNGNTISATHGEELYGLLCRNCHGASGMGNGPGTVGTPSGAPAAFAVGMAPQYIFWRIRSGVTGSIMPAFQYLNTVSEGDIWDLTAYVASLSAQAPQPDVLPVQAP